MEINRHGCGGLLQRTTSWLAATGIGLVALFHAGAADYNFMTLAGLAGAGGFANGTNQQARFRSPAGVAVDDQGNVYVADCDNDVIRRITAAGVVSTFAGRPGVAGTNDATGDAARFHNPRGITRDSDGNLYVADYSNHAIRKIDTNGAVTTLAGNPGVRGSADGTNRQAGFYYPHGIGVDRQGNVYVADQKNHTIRKIRPDGAVTTLAGQTGVSGSADGTNQTAQFYYPTGLAVDGEGNVFVGDSYNDTIRNITPDGVVTTLAGLAGNSGGADGTNSTARFNNSHGLATDGAGNVYVADLGNHTIRLVTPAGVVTTLGGMAGLFGSDDEAGAAARFYWPMGVVLDGSGQLYVADSGNHTIRVGAPTVVTNATPAPAPGFDLARDFSMASNPNGVWTYGTKTALDGSLIPFGIKASSPDDQGLPISQWLLTANNEPLICQNGNSVTSYINGGQSVLPPGTVWIHPGPETTPYTYGAVRFTTPSDQGGQYLIGASVRSYIDTALSGDTDFHVVVNGAEIFGQFLPSQGATTYTNVVTLAPGDVVDFLVGRGADNQEYASALKIQAALTIVTDLPFPPAVLSLSGPQAVPVGGQIALCAQVAGSSPLWYQWCFQGDALPGATNPCLVLTNSQVAQSGCYSLAVSNLAGTVSSSNLCVTVAGALPETNSVFDLARDFALTSNPNGVWTYGTLTNLAGPFIPFSVKGQTPDQNGLPMDYWQISLNNTPAIYHNGTLATGYANSGQQIIPPGATWIHPGPENTPYTYGAARLTVPPGLQADYLLQAVVQSYLDGPLSGDTDFHVVTNGAELFGQFLPGRGAVAYTNILRLAPGDTVDFLVGRGADNQEFASALKIQAVLSIVTNFILAPAIVSLSPDQTAYAGSNLLLQVQATGSQPLSYQWLLEGVPLPDATSAGLLLSDVQTNQSGRYSVIVSNVAGSVTSTNLTLVIRLPNQDPPAIVRQPASQFVGVGTQVTMSVEASGSGALSYQWFCNGAPLTGQTNATLLLTNAQPAQAGTYTVRVSNQFGAATSLGAVLNVDDHSGGTVLFSNFIGTNRPCVFDLDGITKLEGAAYLAQLYAGPDSAHLEAVGAAVPFRTGVSAGLFSGGIRYIASVQAGAVAALQVRAWAASAGATYESALLAGGKAGASKVFSLATGGQLVPPRPLIGLESFSLSNGAIAPVKPLFAQKLVSRLLPPPLLLSDLRPTAGIFHLYIGSEPGLTCLVDYSADLVTWHSLTNFVNVDGYMQVQDQCDPTVPSRFYRVRVSQ